MLHTSFDGRFTSAIPQDHLTPGLGCKPSRFVTIPAYYTAADPDPMLDLVALEEESSAINDLNHYSCTSYEY